MRLARFVSLAWRHAPAYAAALGAVALVSAAIALLPGRTHIANISILYLIAVLAIAVEFGSWPAVVASVAAFLTFDYLFVQPIYTFTVADPGEWVSLVLFLLTAIITGQLAAGQRRRAHEAQQREREAVVLYDIVRLMGEPDLVAALRAVAERLRTELSLAAVAIELDHDGADGRRIAVGEPDVLATLHTQGVAGARFLSEGRGPSAAQRGTPGRWIRVVPPRPAGAQRPAAREHVHTVPIKAQERRVGTLLVMQRPDAPPFQEVDDRLLSAVAAQVGLAVERARLRREATEAEILRRTEMLRTALLNAVSHDLRTPLAAIKASAESLLQTDVRWSEEDRAGFAAAINREADRLTRLVANLLDMSRIEAGALRLQLDWYDVGELIREVVDRLAYVLSGRTVELALQEGLPPVPLDYLLMDQVVTNLLENAARYTPPDSPIRVVAERREDAIRVQVADRGPGIPPDKRERIFDKFFRLQARPGVRGSGLGLAVSRGLVEAHGGRIWVEDNPGGGARFVFELPLRPTGASPTVSEPPVAAPARGA